jgi:mannose-1-phosphate guanylyltransferase / mannose-6-phosphate isomerase
MPTVQPVVMAGGSGTRLWPVSRAARPKQFQALIGDRSMFQDTILRVAGQIEGVEFAAPVVIGAQRFGELIDDQLASIGVSPSRVILEPCARNTAAVAAIAAQVVAELGEADQVLLLPSDHFIRDEAAFRSAIAQAFDVTARGWVTTFGISPRGPETGYGYIRKGELIAGEGYRVAAFVEKPDLETAQAYLSDPDYAWNAGIFQFQPATLLEEMRRHARDIADASLVALAGASKSGARLTLDEASFEAVRAESVDYALMEHTDRAAVFGPLECGWDDIGSWSALADISGDGETGDVISVGCQDSYLRSDGSVLVASAGLRGMIVVAHEGSVLIVPRDRAQDVKQLVERLKSDARADRL